MFKSALLLGNLFSVSYAEKSSNWNNQNPYAAFEKANTKKGLRAPGPCVAPPPPPNISRVNRRWRDVESHLVVYNQVLGTASFVVNRFKRLGAFFRKRVKSRATRQGGFQWTIQPAIPDDLDEENQEGIENKDNDNDEDFDGPDVLSPSERIQSQRQAASIKVANRMQRSALALALQWREGCSPESAPRAFKKICALTPASWYSHLPTIVAAINSSISSSQGAVPSDFYISF